MNRPQPGDFWSRRRAAVAAEAKAERAESEAIAAEARAAERDERPDAEVLAELNLPDPDLLEAGDDVRGFMAEAVPDRLRRRALRRLWRLNPVLANVDGLVDYGEDFTDAATVVENMQTAYRVGRGMLAHIEKLAAEAEAKARADAGDADADPAPETDDAPEPEIAAADEPDTPDPPHPQPAAAVADTQAADAPDLSVRRRMRFAFEG